MQQQDYVDNHKQQSKISSQNNQIKLINNQSQRYYNNKQILKKQQIDQIQIQQEQQNQINFYKKQNQQYRKIVYSKLSQHPHFVKIFKCFLEKHLRLTFGSYTQAAQNLWRLSCQYNQASFERQEPIFKYKVRPLNDQGLHRENSLVNLVKKYNTKPLKIIQNFLQETGPICSKLINKQIGETNKFHVKKAILTANSIYYLDENQKQQKSKRIDLKIQKMRTIDVQKQQGNIFSKKIQLTSVVILEGVQRNLIFERDTMQGKQLLYQLQKLMGLKIYRINCLISRKINIQLQSLILGQNKKVLNLSKQFILPFERYPFIKQRQLSIKIILDIIQKNKQFQIINLLDCKLSHNQLLMIIKGLNNCKNIKFIDISQNIVDKQLLQNIYHLLSQQKNQKNIQIYLRGCAIKDQIFIGQILGLRQIINRILILDLSQNNLTDKSIIALANCIGSQKQNSSLKKIFMNNCSFQQLSTLSLLITSSILLQQLYANVQQPFIDTYRLKWNQTQIKQFFKICKQSQLKILSITGNQPPEYLIGLLQKSWGGTCPNQIYMRAERISKIITRSLNAEIL